MTAQAGEILRFNGEELWMCELPLDEYFFQINHTPAFRVESTACWRGYVGQWEVVDGRLYLMGLDAHLEDGSPVTVESLFPGQADRVFAHWYSGTLRCPLGELLEYVHMGWASIYERDLLITIENGMVTVTCTRANTLDPEGRVTR